MSVDPLHSNSTPQPAAPAAPLTTEASPFSFVEVRVKFLSNTFTLSLPSSATVSCLREQLAGRTRVREAHQKLIHNKFTGKLQDAMRLADLPWPTNAVILLIGSPDSAAEAAIEFPKEESSDDDKNDDEDNESGRRRQLAELHAHPEVVANLASRHSSITINLLHPPVGKRLLVLDLDYTLLFMRHTQGDSDNERSLVLRPFTHEFLSSVYPHYDICFFSQTSWKWLEVKATELGLLTNPQYRICFVLDKSAMFKVTSMRRGKTRRHYVKPLSIIWSKLPQYSAANTIHIDDLSRNFALCPSVGLKIRAFNERSRHDSELILLAQYLQEIAKLPSFAGLDHSNWRKGRTK